MKPVNRRRVLAIGIDAAEPTLVRELIARDELPTLNSWLAKGTWNRVVSPVHIGSAAAWPTFITGTDPAQHGIYGEWQWQPESMSVSRWRRDGLVPFWKDVDRRGLTIGALDVPFAPLLGLSRGFEVSEWGAHDVLEGREEGFPHALVQDAIRRIGPHPLASRRFDAAGPEDHGALTRLSADCLAGVRLRGELAARLIEAARPDLSIIVFPETHTASHHLWHTLGPEHPLYTDARFNRSHALASSLPALLGEIDRQIARLAGIAGPEAAVFVFGLHGMQPSRGIPTLLHPLLCDAGFSRRSDWRARSWRERARSVFAAGKRRTPRSLKKLYYRSVSQPVTHRLAQTTMLPLFDWRHTRAFSLPTDQHGWIRLNLAGRENEGIVAPEQYEDTCSQVAALLRTLATRDGRPIVRDVIHVARDHGGAPPPRLPDLVVHWHDAAFDDPVRLRNHSIHASPAGRKLTGQHAPDGFCLARGAGSGSEVSSPVAARDLHRLMTAALGL